MQKGNAEAEDGLDSVGQDVIIYSEDDIEREAMRELSDISKTKKVPRPVAEHREEPLRAEHA